MMIGVKLIEYKTGKQWPLELSMQPPHPVGFVEMNYQDALTLRDQNEADYNLYIYNINLPNIIRAQIGKIVDDAVSYGEKIENEFKTENVLLGITQLGLTGPVLGIMTKKYVIQSSTNPSYPYEVTLTSAIRSGSLTEVPKIIDKIILDQSSWIWMAPVITAARLTSLKNKVISYLLKTY